MKIAAYSFSEKGYKLGESLVDSNLFNLTHRRSKKIDGGVKEDLKKSWYDNDALIFIGATGIAVRMIAPYIKHKTKDPAVIVIDDSSNFVISLLSGHIGGANELSLEIANIIGATPVITTASDNRGIEAIDLFAQKNNYHMENLKTITDITGKMVDGKKIGFFSEDKHIINYPNLVVENDLDKLINNKELDGLIIVTSEKIDKDKITIAHTILRPKNLNVGIGCRRGMPKERIVGAVKDLFKELNLSTKSIKSFATVEVKKDELGIIQASEYFNAGLKIFSLEEIGKVDYKFNKSDFVKKTIGVYSVAEPSAYLLGGEFLSMRTTHEGITLSVTREEQNG